MKVKVYLTDRGIMGLEDQFTPDEFKAIEDEVIIRFKESN